MRRGERGRRKPGTRADDGPAADSSSSGRGQRVLAHATSDPEGGGSPGHARAPQRSAGIVPVRRTREGSHVLVLRAWRHWDFPKGRIEPGETALDAALREAQEEAGLDDLRFPWGEVFRDTEPYAGGKVSRYFVAETRRGDIVLPVNPELGRPEHHEGRWLDFSAARVLLVPRLQAILDWAHGVVTEG